MIPVNIHLKAYEEYLILLNSPIKTRKSYLSIFRKYLEYCNNQHIDDAFTDAAVKQYLLYRYSQKMDWKTINMDYSAIWIFCLNWPPILDILTTQMIWWFMPLRSDKITDFFLNYLL